MAGDLGSISAKMILDISDFSNNMQKASNDMQATAQKTNSSMSKFANKMTSTGKAMTVGITTPIVGFITASAKLAMSAQQGFAKVNSIAQLSGREWDNYIKQMKQGASQTGLTYNEYAEATYSAISAGVKYTDTTKFLDKANKLAKGGFTDLAKATDVLTTIQNAYGLTAKDTARISDVLIQTQNKGKTTVNELAGAIGRVIPTAQAQGVSIEQLGASYAIMTSKGIATAEATTYMNSMFNELGKSGTNVDKTLREISGKSFKELMESGKSVGDVLQILDEHAKANGKSLTDLFGSAEAGKAALSLLGNGAEEFNGQLQGMNEATGATDKAFKTVAETAESKCKKAISDLKNAMADFGEALLPIITDVAKLASKFFEWASKMAQTHPNLTRVAFAIMGVIAVIGPLLLFIGLAIKAFLSIKRAVGLLRGGFKILSTFIKGKLIGSFISLFTTLMANPITWVVLAIVALVGALVLLYKKCEWFRNGVNKLWDVIKDAWGTAIDWIKEKLNQFADFIANFPQNFSAFVDGIVQWVQQLPSRIGEWLDTTLTNIGTWVLEMILKAIEVGSQFVENCITWISQLPGKIAEWLTNAITAVATWVDQMIDKAIQVSSEFVGNVLAFIILLPVKLAQLLWNCITTVGQWGIDMWNKAFETGSNFVSALIEWICQLPGRIWTWLVDTYTKVQTWKQQMRDKAIELGTEFVTKLIEWISQLPGRIWTWLVNTYNKAAQWKTNMVNKAREAGQEFLNKVNEKFQQLPGKIWAKLQDCISKAQQWATSFAQKGREGAQKMAQNVINGIQSLPSRVSSIGRNIVQGLWNGISGAAGWLYSKVSSFASGVLNSMKGALGIHSPSRKARDLVGKFIPQGVGVGMLQEAPRLYKQAQEVSNTLLNNLHVDGVAKIVNVNGLYNSLNVPSLAGASTTNTNVTNEGLKVYINTFNNNSDRDLDSLMEYIYSYDMEHRRVRGDVK